MDYADEMSWSNERFEGMDNEQQIHGMDRFISVSIDEWKKTPKMGGWKDD